MQVEKKASSSPVRGESLVGRRFGRLVVVRLAERPPGASQKARGSWWLCRCQCGREKIVARSYLVQNNVTSCGCKQRGRHKRKDIKLASSCERLATECTCATCRKPFDRLSDQWAYKATIGARLYWFCSWRCLRAATKQERDPTAAHA